MENTALNLYHLERLKHKDYDRMSGIVVAAPDEKTARQIAVEQEFDHDVRTDWLSADFVSCHLIGTATPDTQVGYIMHDTIEG